MPKVGKLRCPRSRRKQMEDGLFRIDGRENTCGGDAFPSAKEHIGDAVVSDQDSFDPLLKTKFTAKVECLVKGTCGESRGAAYDSLGSQRLEQERIDRCSRRTGAVGSSDERLRSQSCLKKRMIEGIIEVILKTHGKGARERDSVLLPGAQCGEGMP